MSLQQDRARVNKIPDHEPSVVIGMKWLSLTRARELTRQGYDQVCKRFTSGHLAFPQSTEGIVSQPHIQHLCSEKHKASHPARPSSRRTAVDL